MTSKRVYVDHLSRVDLFEGFSRKDLEHVAAAGDHVTVRADRQLFKEDDTGNEAYVILSGTVAISRKGKSITNLGPGAIFGELSMLDQGPRTATAVCVTDCDLLVLSRSRFRGLIEQVPAVGQKLLATLAARVRDLDRRYYG